jgi:ABC-type multidrug transport system ATPase subunit
MRRVALAGVLALEPEVLVLDEPTAGLDPQGRRRLLEYILNLHRQGVTLVIVSHNMEELAEVCDRLYVISGGRTVMSGTPGAIFNRASDLRTAGAGRARRDPDRRPAQNRGLAAAGNRNLQAAASRGRDRRSAGRPAMCVKENSGAEQVAEVLALAE